jgi:hypothetical protein
MWLACDGTLTRGGGEDAQDLVMGEAFQSLQSHVKLLLCVSCP